MDTDAQALMFESFMAGVGAGLSALVGSPWGWLLIAVMVVGVVAPATRGRRR